MAAALLLDPLLLQEDAGLAAALKKLLHLRAAFEAPLLGVFGFPLILRHQLAAADCCACCSRCCCCMPAAPPHIYSESTSCRAVAAADYGAAAVAAVTPTTNLPRSAAAATTAYSGLCRYDDTSHPITSAAAAPRGDAAVTSSYASLPCSPSRCACCRGYGGAAATVCARGLAQPQVAASSNSSSGDGNSTSSSGTGSRGRCETETTRAVRHNRKRLRLVGEEPVAAVVAAAVCRHRNSRNARTQDERAVEILLSRNVLRQVKLPIDAGSYVLFFTVDWLQCLQRSIRAAQGEALVWLKQQRCCAKCGSAAADREHTWSSSSSNTDCSKDSTSGSRRGSRSSPCIWVSDTSTFCCRCGHSAAADGSDAGSSRPAVLEDSGSSSSAGGCSLRSTCPSSCAVDMQESASAPLRFTPVLRQDDVETEAQCGQSSDGAVASFSRKRVLLHLPAMLGEQLKDVLLLQLLNVHTQTHIDKPILEEVLRNYLRAWHLRRRDTVVYLKEVLRSAEELLEEVNKEEAVSCEETKQQSAPVKSEKTGGSENDQNRETRARRAVVTSSEGRRNENQTKIGLIKQEEGSNLHARHEATENSRRTREEKRRADHGHCDAEDKKCQTRVRAAPGALLPEFSNDSVSLYRETEKALSGSASPCSHICVEKHSKTELEIDGQEPRRTEEQRSTFDTKRSTPLEKQLLNVGELLQRGCEAAAEVFSLQESVASRAALRTEENILERWSTGVGGDEGKTEEAWTEGWERQRGTQKEEQEGGKARRIKEENDEELGLTEKNEGARRGAVEFTKTVEQRCESHDGRFGVEGSRRAQPSSAHAAALCLREKVRCATAIVRLLTEGEKTLPTQLTSQVVTPNVAHVKSLSPRDQSPGTPNAAACTTARTIFRRMDISPTGEGAAVSSGRGGGEAPNLLKQQSAARSAARRGEGQLPNGRKLKGRGKNNLEEEKQQHQDISESPVQRELDGILLLLYDVPLLYSRAGSNSLSLAVPQQGLLVRWLRAGRKEVLQSIRRRRFKEILWVDIERRGLLKSGLGSRMTLLDLNGIGEVESAETAAGVVVRLAEEADHQT